ncbi:IRX7 [Symbiodinium sp. CCMP2592]|nr:IRX7 [Symbiodinium sp. CCMP2592]
MDHLAALGAPCRVQTGVWMLLFLGILGSVCPLLVGAMEPLSRAPFMACVGTEVIKRTTWEHTQILVDKWPDIDLPHSRVIRKVLWAITHNDMLEEHAEDCGFALATVLLVALRAIDYDDGRQEAQKMFHYLTTALIPKLQPYFPTAAKDDWAPDLNDLRIYPFLLGLEPQHDCYGTTLRLFVYKLPELTKGVLHCHHGQWGLEALIPHWLRQGSCLTEDPDQADFFLVPWHTWCDRMVYKMNQTRREVSAVYIDMIKRKDDMLPYWSKNDGYDHVFVFSDQGMNFFPEWRDYIPHSMFIVTEALTPRCGPSCFNAWKDFVVPGHTDYFRYTRMAKFNLPSEQRTLLFNFHGRHPGLNDLYKKNFVRGNIIKVFDGLEGVSVGGFTDDYFERMGASHFCLVPMGTSSWTNHLYEAFFAGCIPVILSDGFKVPFESFLDWPSFSVKWPMEDVSMDLYNFLLNTPVWMLRRMKAQFWVQHANHP